MTNSLQIRMWPVADLVPHPDNPRTVNIQSPKFIDLTESIKANGILEPLTVRERPAEIDGRREVLSGHRRLAAAKAVGLKEVPIRDLGPVPDDLAYDIVAMSNLHEDLTPLEEGRRAAIWLDKYSQDVAAVASKLGKTVAWVVQHAQIDRGLSPEWKAAAQGLADWQVDRGAGADNQFAHWTASHWCVIAKLPLSIQAAQLAEFKRGWSWNYDRWSVAELEEQMRLEVLYLAKAPFDEGGCSECMDRTDRVLNLYGEVEEVTGDKTRCLNKKCWDKKVARHAKEEFRQIAEDRGVPDAIPISLLKEPKDYWRGGEEHHEKIAALKKSFKGLVTLDRIEIVKEGAKGAVPAIVVAGKGRNAVKWVRIVEPKAASRGGSRGPTAAELAKQKAEAEDRDRKDKVRDEMVKKILKAKQPDGFGVVLCCLLSRIQPGDWPDSLSDTDYQKITSAAFAADPAAGLDWLLARFWAAWVKCMKHNGTRLSWTSAVAVGRLFGIDARAELAKKTLSDEEKKATGATETPGKEGKHRKKRASGAARRKKAKEKRQDEGDPVDPVDPSDDEGENCE